MPHPLFGADRWSRAARPSEFPQKLKLREAINDYEATASVSEARERATKASLRRRLGDWLPRFGAWIRDIPLP